VNLLTNIQLFKQTALNCSAFVLFLCFVVKVKLLFGGSAINQIVATGAYVESYAPSAKIIGICFQSCIVVLGGA